MPRRSTRCEALPAFLEEEPVVTGDDDGEALPEAA